MSANDRSPWWWIDFEAIPGNVSRLSGGERRLLLIAASIGGTTTTEPLGELIGGLDRANVALVLAALSHAAGTHEHSDLLPERTDEGLEAVEATAAELSRADGPLAAIVKHLSDGHASLKATTDSLLANGLADPWSALAGATPYLRMFGIVTGGRLLARSALAAQRLLDAGDRDPAFLTQRVVTAHFYASQLLPQAAGLAGGDRRAGGPADRRVLTRRPARAAARP